MFVTKCDNFTVNQFVWWAINSNAYVVCEGKSLLIVDPIDSEEFYEFVWEQKAKNILIILTHSHYDHISGLNHLKELEAELCVLASKKCSLNIRNARKNLSHYSNIIAALHDYKTFRTELVKDFKPFVCEAADVTFEARLKTEWSGHSLQLTEYKGHSEDSICCILDNKYLFSGDTLMPFPTVTQLPGGSKKLFLKEDIPKLKKLIGKIDVVFPGHGMPGDLCTMCAVNVKQGK